MTYLVDRCEVFGQVRKVDIGLNDVGEGHIGAFEYRLKVLGAKKDSCQLLSYRSYSGKGTLTWMTCLVRS